jgi:hypothetical protein
MRDRLLLAFLGILTIALLPQFLAAQPSDPVNGTWVLNVAKSTFKPGPAYKSETRTYEMVGNQLRMKSSVVDADGTSRDVLSTYTVDGKEYPVTGAQEADSQALKQIDRYTVEGNLMKNGKVVQTAKRVVSKDGKVLTIWFKGTDAKGRKIDNTLVFDRR